ncbi:MAG: glycoside hydrolase family 2 protein [Clostridia bacterium]|nr:glycoside hydrolase family 2 protein [Clostridia bacterium]
MNVTPISLWTMHRNGFPERTGTVPCSMYSILIDNALIPDPFDQDNEYAATELSREDCDFTSSFIADEEMLAKEHLTIRSNGIDTLATIFINETPVGYAENMHRVWEFDIKGVTVPGENKVRIHFDSPMEYMERKQAEHFVYGDTNSGVGIAHLRKSLCMSGWDWGPKLPDMGLYRPVEIVSWNGARVEDVMLHQEHKDGTVTLTATLTVSEGAMTKAVISLTAPDGTVLEAPFVDGKASIFVAKPELWWPNGLGEHPLYGVKVCVFDGEALNDTWEKRIGLRTMEVSRAKDDPSDPNSGEEFCFVCNGVKFFAMGADYIPEDSMLSRLSRERSEILLRGCIEANYNCVRIWGGGFYPHDFFYDICDELGLVVWQDFMFACIYVWMHEHFEKNVSAEAIDNIRRLRDHASLGLFCGNNEMEQAILDGWDHTPGTDEELQKKDYLELYEHVLPKICAEHCPDVFYWPASPSSGGGFDNPNDPNRGDVHYWGAWHGSIPFESYRQYKFRFLSEFGFESFPNVKTIKTFARPGDMNPFSYIMESHQKCKGGNTKILTYLADKYLYPTRFDMLVYTSQLLQADAIRYGVEHFRRFRGHCMGAVYWQLNDCWPVASWASVDYYNRWKALQYASKRFFAPTLLSAHEDGTTVTMNVSNEQLKPFNGTLTLTVCKADYSVLDEKTYPVSVDAMSALDITTEHYADLVKGMERETYLAFTLTDENGNRVSGGSLMFAKPKYFRFCDPKVAVKIEGAEGEFTLRVSAAAYARAVEIDFDEADLHLEDNFFDITAPGEIVIRAHGTDKKITAEELAAQMTVKTVYSLSEQ